MEQKWYKLTDTSGEIFDVQKMDSIDLEKSQFTALESTDGGRSWVPATAEEVRIFVSPKQEDPMKVEVVDTDVWEENPDKPGYVRRVRNKTREEVFTEVNKQLWKIFPMRRGMNPVNEETVEDLKESDWRFLEAAKDDEYWSIFGNWNESWREEFPECRWTACYAVTGGSEGYYVHVDAIKEDSRELIFLGKFWTMDTALEFSNALTKVLGA